MSFIRISPSEKISIAGTIMRNSMEAYDWAQKNSQYNNQYMENMVGIINEMMEYLFTTSEIEAIDWFNNEWVYDNSSSVYYDGIDYYFSGPEDYMNFLVAFENFGQYSRRIGC